jgi:glutathione S-transferase
MPTTEELADMNAFNKPSVDAGIIVSADGFLPSSTGTLVTFNSNGDGDGGNAEPTVTRGPFALDNLVSGFWIVQLGSIDEAVEWAKKIPFKKGGSVQIRKVAGPEDFGDALTPEIKQQEEEMRKTVEGRNQ